MRGTETPPLQQEWGQRDGQQLDDGSNGHRSHLFAVTTPQAVSPVHVPQLTVPPQPSGTVPQLNVPQTADGSFGVHPQTPGTDGVAPPQDFGRAHEPQS